MVRKNLHTSKKKIQDKETERKVTAEEKWEKTVK